MCSQVEKRKDGVKERNQIENEGERNEGDTKSEDKRKRERSD